VSRCAAAGAASPRASATAAGAASAAARDAALASAPASAARDAAASARARARSPAAAAAASARGAAAAASSSASARAGEPGGERRAAATQARRVRSEGWRGRGVGSAERARRRRRRCGGEAAPGPPARPPFPARAAFDRAPMAAPAQPARRPRPPHLVRGVGAGPRRGRWLGARGADRLHATECHSSGRGGPGRPGRAPGAGAGRPAAAARRPHCGEARPRGLGRLDAPGVERGGGVARGGRVVEGRRPRRALLPRFLFASAPPGVTRFKAGRGSRSARACGGVGVGVGVGGEKKSGCARAGAQPLWPGAATPVPAPSRHDGAVVSRRTGPGGIGWGGAARAGAGVGGAVVGGSRAQAAARAAPGSVVVEAITIRCWDGEAVRVWRGRGGTGREGRCFGPGSGGAGGGCGPARVGRCSGARFKSSWPARPRL
jgi:hypothetical protein